MSFIFLTSVITTHPVNVNERVKMVDKGFRKTFNITRSRRSLLNRCEFIFIPCQGLRLKKKIDSEYDYL